MPYDTGSPRPQARRGVQNGFFALKSVPENSRLARTWHDDFENFPRVPLLGDLNKRDAAGPLSDGVPTDLIIGD